VLTDPTNTTGDAMSFFGPNFTYTPAAVPEPGTLIMLGTGMLCLAAILRHKINL